MYTKLMLLQRARAEALQKQDELLRKLDSGELPAQPEALPSPQSRASAASSQGQVVIALLRGYSLRQKKLADLNKRIQDHQDLADAYGDWIGAQFRQRATLHGMIRSALLILLIFLSAYLLSNGP